MHNILFFVVDLTTNVDDELHDGVRERDDDDAVVVVDLTTRL